MPPILTTPEESFKGRGGRAGLSIRRADSKGAGSNHEAREVLTLSCSGLQFCYGISQSLYLPVLTCSVLWTKGMELVQYLGQRLNKEIHRYSDIMGGQNWKANNWKSLEERTGNNQEKP